MARARRRYPLISMPTYDYQCSNCGTDFEVFQSFSEDTLKRCPTKKSGNSPQGCTSVGKGKVTKIFSAPGISFKGSGFYKTDSRSSSSSSDSSSESSTSSSSESKSSDSKSTESSSTSSAKTEKKSDSSSKKSDKKSTTPSSSSSND